MSKALERLASIASGAIAEGFRAALRDPDAASRLQSVSDNSLAEVARLFPELANLRADLPPPLADRTGAGARLLEGLRLVLVALLEGRVPGALFLDDIQWADDASVELLNHVVRRFRDHGLFILLTSRDDEGPAAGRLRQLIGDARRSGTATTLTVERLRLEDVTELVARSVQADMGAAELAGTIYQQTEGLPLFVVACLEAFLDGTNPLDADAVPAGVRDLLRARLARLSETARQVLATAVVIGHSFDFDTVRQVSGRDEEEAVTALDELLARRLVYEVDVGVGDAPRFDFTHGLLRHVVMDDMSQVRRRLLHRRVGDALRDSCDGRSSLESDPGQVAAHYHSAGLLDVAAEYYCRAGERAQALHANVEALAHFEAALALGYSDGARLHESIGDLQSLIGAYSPAAVSYDFAASHAAPARLPTIERKLGSLFVRLGAWQSAESHFDAALSQMSEADTGERARLLAAQSLTAHRRGDQDRAWVLGTRALEVAVGANDASALAECHNVVGMLARHSGELAEGAHHLESSLELSIADRGARVAALNNLALLSEVTGQPERGLEFLDEALEVCKVLGDNHLQAALLTNSADLLRATSRTSEAMERVTAAVAILADIGADLGSLQPEIWKLTEW